MQAPEQQEAAAAHNPETQADQARKEQQAPEEFSFEEPPIIEMATFFNRDSNPNWENECKKVAYSFHKFGICVVRDPRVNHEENDQYIDMLERYFEHVGEQYYAGNELADSRPELSF